MSIRTVADAAAVREQLGQARAYVKFQIFLALSDGVHEAALARAHADADCRPHFDALHKAAVQSMTTAPGSAGSLAATRPFGQAFLRFAAVDCVIDRLLGAQRVPPNVAVASQAGGAQVEWAGEGLAAPLSSLTVDVEPMPALKLQAIVPISKELARFSDPSAILVVESELARATSKATNLKALDPSLAAIANVRPASLTHGATAVPPSGDVEQDVALTFAAISDGGPEKPIAVTSPRGALYLATRRNAGGQRLFPGVTLTGGEIFGVPLLVAPGAPDQLTAIDAAGVAIVDLGLELDAAEHATLQMTTAPTNASATPTPTTLVSLWQSNSVAMRSTRFLNWTRRPDAVAFLSLTGSPLP